MLMSTTVNEFLFILIIKRKKKQKQVYDDNKEVIELINKSKSKSSRKEKQIDD